MATVIAVHGTFAHIDSKPGDDLRPPSARQWWEQGSQFEAEIQTLVEAMPGGGEPGKVTVTRFKWGGENSESARRTAGKRLYQDMKALDAKGEVYAVIGHSHGGSVVDWALLEAAARKDQLNGLSRWITVGTPFVNLKKEPFLVQRLDLLSKVAFVASMMLMLMFVVYIVAEMLDGGPMLIGRNWPNALFVTAGMMCLPILFFYFFLKYWDSATHVHYRASVRQRANTYFAPRWRSLTHVDDEAVQGLAFLPGAKLYFFDKSFAVQSITWFSVIALPLLYILLLHSPQTMVGIGDLLKKHVYDTSPQTEAEKALREMRSRTRELRKQDAAGPASQDRRAAWSEIREKRRELAKKYPDLTAAERALRFKQRFFEDEGKPCEGGKICGAGRDIKVNSALLLHLVTDELASAVVGDNDDSVQERFIWSLVIPAVLVPLIFGLVGLGLMTLIRALANLISGAAASVLNTLTNAEVKRAAFGNDTEGEVALGAVDRPVWIERSPPRLPLALANVITDYSNGNANQSLAKFRRVIGQLASAEPKHTADTAITTYFTWKELVHSSYFDVPAFRKLMAQALSQAPGFTPSTEFQADPEFRATSQWLAEIEGAPGTLRPPAAEQPTEKDAGAVAAAVASTVKAAP